MSDHVDSAQIRAEQVERNRRRFGSDDYPGGNIPGVGWDRLGQLADVIPIRPADTPTRHARNGGLDRDTTSN